MSEEDRFEVSLTEAELDALVTTIGKVKVSEIHLCRCKAVHTGLGELKEAQMRVRAKRLTF